MEKRLFGRTKWAVSEVGYGMWGMAGWTESNDKQSRKVLRSGRQTRSQLF